MGTWIWDGDTDIGWDMDMGWGDPTEPTLEAQQPTAAPL